MCTWSHCSIKIIIGSTVFFFSSNISIRLCYILCRFSLSLSLSLFLQFTKLENESENMRITKSLCDVSTCMQHLWRNYRMPIRFVFTCEHAFNKTNSPMHTHMRKARLVDCNIAATAAAATVTQLFTLYINYIFFILFVVFNASNLCIK